MDKYTLWHEDQVITHGQVKKPLHYKIAQFRAMQELFEGRIVKGKRVLDVGCGEGSGMLGLHFLGFDDVVGVDINEEKIKIAKTLDLDVFVSLIESADFHLRDFDYIWCSHMLEHAYDVEKIIGSFHFHLIKGGTLFVILPYPDITPASAHSSSIALGLNVQDQGMTTRKFFSERGFRVDQIKFSNFREPEIWLILERK